MNRIDDTLKRLKAQGKKMLSPYITAGDPTPTITVPLMHKLVYAGADIIELGIPFSDPMAEGLVIQHAMERALAHSINCDSVLAMVKEFRKQDKVTPIVLMGYLNPIEQYGYERFAKAAQSVGVDGTIIVDLPPEECTEIVKVWQKNGLYTIFLCSLTTSAERMILINQFAQGYLYYVSLKGVTGSDALDIAGLKPHYLSRKKETDLPLMIGFGIKTAAMAAQVAAFADGVIVGAAIITAIAHAYATHEKTPLQPGTALLQSMRQAIDLIGKTT